MGRGRGACALVAVLAGLAAVDAQAAPCPSRRASWVSAPRGALASPVQASEPRAGFALARTRPFTAFGASEGADWLRAGEPLTVLAAPAEREPATFAIVASKALRNVQVEVSSLHGPRGDVPTGTIVVREVRYAAVRKSIGGPDTEVTPRFLPQWEPGDIRRGQFREVWIDLPADVGPGVYRGTVTVRSHRGKQTRPLVLRVRNIRLVDEPEKSLGMYYTMAGLSNDADAVRRELSDMRAHGVRHLVTGMRPRYSRRGGAVVPDVLQLRQGLDLIEAAGFTGTIVVESGFVHLAWLLGHKDVAFRGERGESLDGAGGEEFRDAATAGLRALRQVDASYPSLDLAVTHLDEIFNADRLDLFLRFAELTRAVSPLPQYATLHTVNDEATALLDRVDPFVELRGHHGYSFEWWLERGQTVQAYAAELERTGDRAWYYHNDRGSFVRPLWARIVNGYWLWASPFQAHVPWTYQRFDGNPLDDTDCEWHDFGFAFPDPRQPDVLVPTLAWEATREGFDDLRYLTTLQREIEFGERRGDPSADAASRFLASLRAELLVQLPVPDAAAQLRRVGSEAEAPYVSRIARHFGAAGLSSSRERLVEHIQTLQVARLGRRGTGAAPP